MQSFSGFPDGKVRLTSIPAPFFTQLLPAIDHLGELKVTLYIFWFLDHQEGSMRYITAEDLRADPVFMTSLGRNGDDLLAESLERAVFRGTLLKLVPKEKEAGDAVYFLNTSRSRAAIKGLEQGTLDLDPRSHSQVSLGIEQPNIYRLYEENIGPLTPMISDILKEAETLYPFGWIEEAIGIAVTKNVRNWRYIEAILQSWKEKGHHEKDRRDSDKDRRRYVEGEYADLIEH